MTQTFVHELPLVLSGDDERQLRIRFQLARDVYNALLGECLRRLHLMRESRLFQTACRTRNKEKRLRLVLKARKRFGLRPYDLNHWASVHITPSWITAHLDTQVVRALARRAFLSTWEYQLGIRGHPRFKGPNQIDSIEGQSNIHALRFRDDHVIWRGLSLRAICDVTDPYAKHALSSQIKYVRIVRRRIGRRPRYFAQLVCAGTPYVEPALKRGEGLVGIDPGPRIFAIAGAEWAARVDLASNSTRAQRKLRRLQRSMERKRRANNRGNYLTDGQSARGGRRWTVSRSERRVRAAFNEEFRRAREHRRSVHGALINALLSLGNDFRVERNSFGSFQRRFGRSVDSAAPGEFVSRLIRKAANAGGKVELLPRILRLSQVCHGCGGVKPKPLSQRVHRCACGIGPVQRDLYSAVLAMMTTFDPEGSTWRFDAEQAQSVWSGVGSHLSAASSPLTRQEFVSWARTKAAFDERDLIGPVPRTPRLADKDTARTDEAADDVGNDLAEGRGESVWSVQPGQIRHDVVRLVEVS